MKVETNEYVRIEDQANAFFVDSLDERKGVIALTNYKKTQALDETHSLFLVNETDKIE